MKIFNGVFVKQFMILLIFQCFLTTDVLAECNDIQGVYKESVSESSEQHPVILYLAKDNEGLIRWFQKTQSNLEDEYFRLTRLLTKFNNHFRCVNDTWEIITYNGGLDHRNRLNLSGDTLIFSVEDKLSNKNDWSKRWIWKFQRTTSKELKLEHENRPILLQHTRFGWAKGAWNDEVNSPINSCEKFMPIYSHVITGLESKDIQFFQALDKNKTYLCGSLRYTSVFPLILADESTFVAEKPTDCHEIMCDEKYKLLLDNYLRYKSVCKSYPGANGGLEPLCY